MWRTGRSHRRLFLTGGLSLVVLAVAVSLLAWHILTQPPIPPQATCGTINFGAGPTPQPIGNNAQSVEQCFYHAYQQCAARTMEVIFFAVDVGTRTVYWPEQQGQACQIIAQSSHVGIGPPATNTETCQSVIPKNGGLLFQQCSHSSDMFIAG